MMEKQPTVVNATESNSSSADGSNSGPDAGAGAKTPGEQHEEEVGNVEETVQVPQHGDGI